MENEGGRAANACRGGREFGEIYYIATACATFTEIAERTFLLNNI